MIRQTAYGKQWNEDKLKKLTEYWISKEIEMKDLKDQHSSKMLLSEIKLDSKLSDDLFTERNLEKFFNQFLSHMDLQNQC